VGDTVLHLELRHFYTHKGTEKLFEETLVNAGTMIAESVSGDNCFAHAVAYSQAVENACRADIPTRASAIRLIGLEFERLVCHISDVGGLCTDVGFSVAAASATRIKESLLQASSECCGTRYWRGIGVPGGLRFDVESRKVLELSQAVSLAARQFSDLARVILETPSIQNRSKPRESFEGKLHGSWPLSGRWRGQVASIWTCVAITLTGITIVCSLKFPSRTTEM